MCAIDAYFLGRFPIFYVLMWGRWYLGWHTGLYGDRWKLQGPHTTWASGRVLLVDLPASVYGILASLASLHAAAFFPDLAQTAPTPKTHSHTSPTLRYSISLLWCHPPAPCIMCAWCWGCHLASECHEIASLPHQWDASAGWLYITAVIALR